MYHYTYIIEDLQPNSLSKYYIGLRSSNCHPLADPYMSSSKSLKPLVLDEPTRFIKSIIEIWPSRELALAHEIWLHAWHNVSANPVYYNKAMQTSAKFDTTGITRSVETLERASKSLSNPSKETRLKMSNAKRGKLPPNFNTWVRSAKGKSYYHNVKLNIEKRFLPNEVPANWIKGRLKIKCSCGKAVDISNFKKYHSTCRA